MNDFEQLDPRHRPVNHNTVLDPDLWENRRLKSSVRGALLNIAQDFVRFVEVPFPVLDIVITGGLANYNYTEHSDIDLHIVTDYASIDCDRAVAELFDSKRLLYNRRYDITVANRPVELYVEDQDRPAVSGGSYSILRSRWITEPRPDLPEYDTQELEHWVKNWSQILRTAVLSGRRSTLKRAVDLLRQYRRLGLATEAGEFSIPNLVYKTLRNAQVMQSVQTLLDRWHDQELSI